MDMQEKMTMRWFYPIALALALVFTGCVASGQDYPPPADQVLAKPEAMTWAPGPGSLPPGASFALLEGVPAERSPLTLRLQFPADYEIPAHSHPANEHVTVLSGTLYLGAGDALDRSAATRLPAGSFAVMPTGVNHFAYTLDEPVTIQLHSNGPWGVTYVDPLDDPR